METALNLNAETIEAVQDLIRSNTGSADFYREAMDQVKSPVLKQAFARVSQTRSSQASLLADYLKANLEDVPEDGTLVDSMHETWTKLRGLLNSGDNYVLLIEAERAEDRIKGKYETLIKKTAGSALSPVLHEQYATVLKTHDEIKATRDAFKNV